MAISRFIGVGSIKRVASSIEQKPWWMHVLLIVLASFLFIQAFGALSMLTLVPARGLSEGATNIPDIRGMDGIQVRFVRWDSGYYLDIVQDGYTTYGAERAFFPLYPLLVAGLASLLGLQIFWSGLIVSTLSYAAACLLLYRWIVIDYPEEVARWTVLWLCVFPMSFFLIAFYAEPLLLLTFVASFYFIRRGNFIASGVCIALAGATRPFAFLLAVPYIVEFFTRREFDRRSWLKFALGALIAPIGTVAFFAFLALQSGNYNIIAIHSSSTESWEGFFLTWPWNTWVDGLRAALFGAHIDPDWFSRALVFQDLAYALFGLAVSIWAVFHLRPSLWTFLIISVLFFYTNHGPKGYAFWSLPRHIAALTPIYLVLALITLKIPARVRWLLVFASLALLGLLSLWFARGSWVA